LDEVIWVLRASAIALDGVTQQQQQHSFLSVPVLFTLSAGLARKRICTPYLTVRMVFFLLKNRIYTVFNYAYMVLANPNYLQFRSYSGALLVLGISSISCSHQP
jgi:hypothetical protein